eukprot:COSAG06_NODE_12293_length_1398_cov_14.257891_3_plen_105_part_01
MTTMTMTMTMMMTMMMMMMAVVLVAAKPKCTYLYWYLLVLFKPDESERGHTERAAPSPRARKGGCLHGRHCTRAHTGYIRFNSFMERYDETPAYCHACYRAAQPT